MKIEHVALWVLDLEKQRVFYESYFSGKAGDKYVNKDKGLETYFIYFDNGARLELMKHTDVKNGKPSLYKGWAHIAFSLGSKATVNALSAKLKKDGFTLINGPRITGDGYYESVIEDPEGNRVELTV